MVHPSEDSPKSNNTIQGKREDGGEHKFEVRTYCFLLFPNLKRDLVINTSTAEFLIQNNASFDRVIKEGISFMNKEQEEKERKWLEKKREKIMLDTQNTTTLRNVDDVKKELSEWCSNFHQTGAKYDTKEQYNSFMRSLISQEMANTFPYLSCEVTAPSRQYSPLTFTRLEPKDNIRRWKSRELERKMTRLVGFSQVIKFLITHPPLIVGHNSIIDLLSISENFLTPLPQNFEEFRSFISESFPFLLDTKYLTTFCSGSSNKMPSYKSTALGDLYDEMSRDPDYPMPVVGYPKNTPEEFLDYSTSSAHNAGYDSLMTGSVFVAWLCRAGLIESDFGNLRRNLLLKENFCKLYLSRSHYPLDLKISNSGQNPLFPPSHAFYLSGKGVFNHNNLRNKLRKFGQIVTKTRSDSEKVLVLFLDTCPTRKDVEKETEWKVVPYKDLWFKNVIANILPFLGFLILFLLLLFVRRTQ
eukprot:TRINITY_DN7076_c0_g1_i5.p1 TRINITY_DN7076_c0_g1~~TRINITY_DN7076_c0_g1_i5.p1  ORF type:complete len:470 (-),score=84.99 TRINITY_DN7076_c0_g1_i5:19-1428(-)